MCDLVSVQLSGVYGGDELSHNPTACVKEGLGNRVGFSSHRVDVSLSLLWEPGCQESFCIPL